MALSGPNVQFKLEELGSKDFVIKSGVKIFYSAYVALEEATGRIVNISDIAGLQPIGFFKPDVASRTGDSDGTEDGPVTMIGGDVIVNVATASAETDNGDNVYAVDENTFTKVASTNIPAVGKIIEYLTGTLCRVRFFSYSEINGTGSVVMANQIIYDAVVDPAGSGDYTTLGAAITAGALTIALIGETTEVGDITLPANCTIHGLNRETSCINMGDNLLDVSDDNVSLVDLCIKSAHDDAVDGFAIEVIGDAFSATRCKFEWTHGINPTNPMNFIEESTGIDCYLVDCEFVYSGTFANQQAMVSCTSGASNWNILDCKIQAVNNLVAVIDWSAMSKGTIDGLHLDAVGFDQSLILDGVDCSYSNLYNVSFSMGGLRSTVTGAHIAGISIIGGNDHVLSGVTGSGAGVNRIRITGARNTLNGVNITSSSGAAISVEGSSNHFNVCTVEAGTVDIVGAINSCRFSACRFTAGFVDDALASIMSFSSCTLSNAHTVLGDVYTFVGCNFGTSLTVTGSQCQLGDSVVSGTMTVSAASPFGQVSNCVIEGTVAVNSDNWTFSKTRVGPIGGAGAATITVVAASEDNTLIEGCRTDAAIVNNGTGTVLANNFVY